MAHEVESIAWKGLMPWHGLGTRFEGEFTPAQLLRAAKLDWSVSTRPLVTNSKTGPLDVLTHKALVRDSDDYVLGVCGPEYVPFQNAEVMEFFAKFTEAGHMSLDVAGSLKRGRIIWGLAKLANGTWKFDGDIMDWYLLLVSPHIWGKSLDILFTPTRVVCANTLQLALSKKVTERFRAVHNQPFSNIKAAAEQTIEQCLKVRDDFAKSAEMLANAKVKSVQQLYRYTSTLFQPALLALDPIEVGQLNRRADRVVTLYHNGPGAKLSSAAGTWWGALNAVTHYVDHMQGNERDTGLTAAWLGQGAILKRKALDTAIEFAKAA